MNGHLGISLETQLALGSALAVIGALLIVLLPLLGWTSLPGAWDFPLGFASGLLAGIGTAVTVIGLIERRRRTR